MDSCFPVPAHGLDGMPDGLIRFSQSSGDSFKSGRQGRAFYQNAVQPMAFNPDRLKDDGEPLRQLCLHLAEQSGLLPRFRQFRFNLHALFQLTVCGRQLFVRFQQRLLRQTFSRYVVKQDKCANRRSRGRRGVVSMASCRPGFRKYGSLNHQETPIAERKLLG